MTGKWRFVLPVLMGLAVLLLMLRGREPPERVGVVESETAVSALEAILVDTVPRAVGYGVVRPAKDWQAVAEVNGKLTEIHPRLRAGEVLPANTVLLAIDPTDYRIAIRRTEADILATKAQIAEIEIRQANTGESLRIEEQSLKLSEQELGRRRDLVGKGSLARSDLDQQQRTTLAQRQSVQSLRNTLDLLPAERRVLEAQLARSRTQLESARLDLERTRISLPFDARIATVDVEERQFVRVGEVLASADSIALAEVEAQLPISRLRAIIPVQDALQQGIMAGDQGRFLKLSAVVRLQGLDLSWDARVTRISPTIDPKTRTAGVIVEVDEPYRQAQPGVRPPLVKGMFVEVELKAPVRPAQLVVPRTAVHDGEVYVVGKDGRLAARRVMVDLVQPEIVTISDGLRAGEMVVVSDPAILIPGMRVAPVLDDELRAHLVRVAGGGAG